MPPLALTPEEFLVLFPSPSPPDKSAYAVSRPEVDPAAALRESEILPLERICSLLAGAGMAPFAWLTRFTVRRYRLIAVPTLIVFYLGIAVLCVPVFAALVLFATQPHYVTNRVVAGIAAAVLYLLARPTAFAAITKETGGFHLRLQKKFDYRILYVVRIANGLARWVTLAGGSKADADPEDPEALPAAVPDGLALLFHDEGNHSCPCPRSSCAGGRLPRGMFAAGIGDAVVSACAILLPPLAMLWTPMLSLAGQFWTTPWSASLGALALLWLVFATAFGVLSRIGTTVSLPIIRFQGMLQRRAVGAGLCELLRRLEAQPHQQGADGGGAKPVEGAAAAAYQYQTIHDHLSRNWFNRYNNTSRTQIVVIAGMSALVASAIITVAVGSCISLWQLLAALTQIAYLVLELVYVSESNLQITAVTDLYRAARTTLRLLSAACPPPPPELRHQLAAHDAVLSSFLEVDGYRLRAFGTAVSYGSLRGLVATAVTVMLGLWSVGRAAGIGFTVESVCPA
ncbi:hypothetical protein DFJ74DRAFT_662857 [Hyaloraphidium curvatum]|nr:hypothetical protein DFJ74DRAFT_662857 [Hyaloraphidium curvatum]